MLIPSAFHQTLLTSSSALRLCVWLCDDCYLQILYFNQCFPPTLRAVERIVYQNCVLSELIASFTATYRAEYPFLGHYNQPPFMYEIDLLWLRVKTLISYKSCFLNSRIAKTIPSSPEHSIEAMHIYKYRLFTGSIVDICIASHGTKLATGSNSSDT